jgi:hypothetical protein
MVQPTRLNRWALAATARTEVDVNALKLRRQPLKEIELPTPEPTGTEILLEVTHFGVCHSDLHIRQGYYDVGGGQTMPLTDHGVVLPLAIGQRGRRPRGEAGS